MIEADRVLAAESVLLTVVTILFSLWYPTLTEAATTTPAADAASRKKQGAAIRSLFRTQGLPLLLVGSLPVVIFTPSAIGVVLQSIESVARSGFRDLAAYDVVQAALIGVYCLTATLLVVIVLLVVSVQRRAQLLSQ